MVDARFFTTDRQMTLAEVADATGAVLAPGGGAARRVTAVSPLSQAGEADVAFVARARLLEAFAKSRAAACFLTPELARGLDPARNLLITDTPQVAHAKLARLLHPEPLPEAVPGPDTGVSDVARLGDNVTLGHGVVIGPHAEIGARTTIGAGSVIGAGVVIGPDARIGAQVCISHALIGARVTIQPGAKIGQAGFGYHPGPSGLVHIPQLGRVVIGDDVDIGANTSIDRGSGEDTVIGPGTKIDNLVQIGHNCRIGAHCIIVAQVGLSGSVVIGDGTVLAGQAGVADHVTIGAGVRVAAKAGVMRDIPDKVTQGGYPAVDIRQWHRANSMLTRLSRGRRGDGT
jgi:UDP-3-O-[3-hydroxymyristoyl] glucosamine N-acyltransferase